MNNKYKFEQLGTLLIMQKAGLNIIKYDKTAGRYLPGFSGNESEKDIFNAYHQGRLTAKEELHQPDPYYIHIMTNMADIYDVINKHGDDADDELWDAGTVLYDEFLESKYNDNNESEYDCIIKFLENYQKIHYELWDNRGNDLIMSSSDMTEIQNILLRVNSVGGKTKENILIAIESENMSLLHENIKHLGYRVLKINK